MIPCRLPVLNLNGRYIITENHKMYGLSSAAGEIILPQKFAEIITHEHFVIASEKTDGNWCVRDTLYGYDRKPIIEGPYRNMHFDKKQQELTVETPWGTEHYQLTKA